MRQEHFTAENAEDAEKQLRLSVLRVLCGEMLLAVEMLLAFDRI